LEVVWKHLPNTREHEYAQISAQALEAARIQGKFWELVDYLFERRKVLGTLDWSAVSAELGLETRKFLQDMESPEVKRRIAADAALGRKAGVKGTPGVFLNRRPVSRLMRKSPGFWEIQADSLREIRASRNQDW
ncbi:MAG: DsbA family protein, partial [Planctomycetota bacterium]